VFCLIDDTGKCITSLNGWPRPRKKSQWKEGRSALEFARFWTVTHPCGTVPPNYLDMLERGFPSIELNGGRPERPTSLPPKESQGDRMHDLHLWGTWSSGSLTICVEAKADEPFGKTIDEEWIEAKKTLVSKPTSLKKTRLEELLDCLWGVRHLTESLSGLRYQLLYALVGTAIQTLKDAEETAESSCETGVLLIHVFETCLTERHKLEKNQRDLERFGHALPNVTVPASGIVPGCLYGPAAVTVPADFAPSGRPTLVNVHLGKLVTTQTDKRSPKT